MSSKDVICTVCTWRVVRQKNILQMVTLRCNRSGFREQHKAPGNWTDNRAPFALKLILFAGFFRVPLNTPKVLVLPFITKTTVSTAHARTPTYSRFQKKKRKTFTSVFVNASDSLPHLFCPIPRANALCNQLEIAKNISERNSGRSGSSVKTKDKSLQKPKTK